MEPFMGLLLNKLIEVNLKRENKMGIELGTIEQKRSFTPPDKVIMVKPVLRVRNPLITDPEHEAYFLFGNASIDYSLPVDRQNNLLNPFSSKEEQKWLEDELDLDLNWHKVKDNYWHRAKVRCDKNTRRLNLSNPKDYIQYLILKANGLHIAPDGESQGLKATYKFALVSEEFETKKSVKKADLQIEAYMMLGKLKDDKDEMVNFLKVYGKKVSGVSRTDFLVSELKKIIEEDIEGFLAVARDKDNYELKLLIATAAECGALIKSGRKYSLPGGDNLCGAGEVATIDNAVVYLKNPANQDILTLLKARVKNAKE